MFWLKIVKDPSPANTAAGDCSSGAAGGSTQGPSSLSDTAWTRIRMKNDRGGVPDKQNKNKEDGNVGSPPVNKNFMKTPPSL